ncbi:MAG: CopG family transcriptional regulator [Azospirillaceae bacterium]|nr:CopG family transcriptional regulator [Azospirillaceae bacterium]
MSKPASIFDIDDNGAKHRAIDEALEAVARGEYVDHEIVREWLLRLAAGEDLPIPVPTKDA